MLRRGGHPSGPVRRRRVLCRRRRPPWCRSSSGQIYARTGPSNYNLCLPSGSYLRAGWWLRALLVEGLHADVRRSILTILDPEAPRLAAHLAVFDVLLNGSAAWIERDFD